jgi:hypothetical protein
MSSIRHDDVVVVNAVVNALNGSILEVCVRNGIEYNTILAETFELGRHDVAVGGPCVRFRVESALLLVNGTNISAFIQAYSGSL